MKAHNTYLTYLVVFLSIVFFNCSLVFAQTNDVSIKSYFLKSFAKEQFTEDLDFIVEKITAKEYNRTPFNFVDEKTFYDTLSQVKAKIENGKIQNLCDFYNSLGNLISLVKDDHMSIREVKWKNDILQKNMSKEKFVLPLSVLTAGKEFGCYVAAANTIPLKSEILSINGIPIREIIISCNKYVMTNEYEAVIDDKITIFNFPKNTIELWALYGFEDSVAVEYLPYQETVKETIQLPLFSLNDENTFKDIKVAPFKMSKKPDYKVENEIAILSIPSFRVGKNRDKAITMYLDFFNNAFSEFKKAGAKRLLIDLSNNLGGSEYIGKILLSYFYNKPYKGTLYRNEATPMELIEKLVVPIKGDSIKQIIKSNYFEGDVYLLISGMTFSAAARFADVFKTYSMGEIIGLETKAFRSHYGEIKWYTLPNTELSFRNSSKFFVSASDDKKPHGIIPDHEIKLNTVNDLFERFENNLLLGKSLEYLAGK